MVHKKISYNSYNKNPKGYVEILPDNFNPQNKYHLICWLGGLGETGDGSILGLDKVYNKTISQWLKTNNIPAIVIVPQDGSGYWTNFHLFVDWLLFQYSQSIDLNQLHLAGLSSGGYGIRDFIIQNSEAYKKFSTFTVMSSNLNDAVPYVKRIIDNNQQVWIHHGVNDGGANQIAAVITFHNALYKLDPTRSLLTAYESMGHSAWEEVFDSSGRNKTQRKGLISGVNYTNWLPTDPDWYTWLFDNGKKPIPEPEPEPIPEVLLGPVKVKSGIASSLGSDGKIYAWDVMEE